MVAAPPATLTNSLVQLVSVKNVMGTEKEDVTILERATIQYRTAIPVVARVLVLASTSALIVGAVLVGLPWMSQQALVPVRLVGPLPQMGANSCASKVVRSAEEVGLVIAYVARNFIT